MVNSLAPLGTLVAVLFGVPLTSSDAHTSDETLAVERPGAAPHRYQIGYRAGDSLVDVTIVLATPLPRPAQFVMPRAIPMGYGTQPYDRFVLDLAARDDRGNPIELVDLDGPRWAVGSSPARPLGSIRYRVDLQRMDRQILSAGDASRVRPGFLGLLGYSVFGFVDGLADDPIVLTIAGPAGWPIMTTLAPLADSLGTATVPARDFYALADAQIMAGPDLAVRRSAAGVPLAVAAYAEGPLALDTIAALSREALERTIDYFGQAPFAHFTVSFELLRPVSPDHAYRFSMEHLESATFRFAVGQVDVGPGRDRFRYNLLHHIVHAWIPKRCAPAGYYPFVWDYAAPIEGIWFAEGWAQYVAADILAATESDPAAARRLWTGRRFDQASADTAPPIAGRSTMELSAIAAHQYSDDFRLSQTVFSRGGRMAEAIDRRVRERTGGRRTFRDVTRALLAWCATGAEPVTAGRLGAIVRQATGVAATDLIDAWLAPRGRAPQERPRP